MSQVVVDASFFAHYDSLAAKSHSLQGVDAALQAAQASLHSAQAGLDQAKTELANNVEYAQEQREREFQKSLDRAERQRQRQLPGRHSDESLGSSAADRRVHSDEHIDQMLKPVASHQPSGQGTRGFQHFGSAAAYER